MAIQKSKKVYISDGSELYNVFIEVIDSKIVDLSNVDLGICKKNEANQEGESYLLDAIVGIIKLTGIVPIAGDVIETDYQYIGKVNKRIFKNNVIIFEMTF